MKMIVSVVCLVFLVACDFQKEPEKAEESKESLAAGLIVYSTKDEILSSGDTIVWLSDTECMPLVVENISDSDIRVDRLTINTSYFKLMTYREYPVVLKPNDALYERICHYDYQSSKGSAKFCVSSEKGIHVVNLLKVELQ
jgi:hypothetical protein